LKAWKCEKNKYPIEIESYLTDETPINMGTYKQIHDFKRIEDGFSFSVLCFKTEQKDIPEYLVINEVNGKKSEIYMDSADDYDYWFQLYAEPYIYPDLS
jgi:hypothetical protein